MKLICVEEHVLDPATGAAAQGLALAEAPYLSGWGRRVVDGRFVADRSRPRVVAPGESSRKALDMGAERILYSIDYPYQSLDGAREFIAGLPISEADKSCIAHGNAERLLGM